jgi:hypothetical protein
MDQPHHPRRGAGPSYSYSDMLAFHPLHTSIRQYIEPLEQPLLLLRGDDDTRQQQQQLLRNNRHHHALVLSECHWPRAQQVDRRSWEQLVTFLDTLNYHHNHNHHHLTLLSPPREATATATEAAAAVRITVELGLTGIRLMDGGLDVLSALFARSDFTTLSTSNFSDVLLAAAQKTCRGS